MPSIIEKSDEIQKKAIRVAYAMIMQGSCLLYDEIMKNKNPNVERMCKWSEDISKGTNFLRTMQPKEKING